MKAGNKRIYGEETEYGLILKNPATGEFYSFGGGKSNEFEKFINQKLEKVGISTLSQTGFWINGARVYLESRGSYPEYATPECLLIRDVAKYDKAGDRFIWELFGKDNPNVVIFKDNSNRNESFSFTTYGCHENYLYYDKFQPSQFLSDYFKKSLAGFLVSRIIFTGSGILRGPQDFRISQRENFIGTLASANTVVPIPLICERHESLGTNPELRGWERFHLICGDSNMSEISTFLKFGTTAIILRMIEDQFISPEEVFPLDPVNTIHLVSKDLGLREKLIKFQSGEELTAIELQERYLAKAREYDQCFPQKLNPELKKILNYSWPDVLKRLKENPRSLNKELDWLILKDFLDSYLKDQGESWENIEDKLYQKLKAIDLRYHLLGTGSLYEFLVRSGKIKRLFSEKEIRWAMDNPPQNTRAKIRSEFLKWRKRQGLELSSGTSNWNILICTHTKGVIDIFNPFETKSPELEKLIKGDLTSS